MRPRRTKALATGVVVVALVAPAAAIGADHGQAPVITSAPARVTDQTSAHFTFTGTRLRCRLDRSRAARCVRQTAYRALAEGRHVFTVWRSRRRGQAARYAWAIDLRRPPRPDLTERPAELTSQPTATFSFADAESGVTLECRLDDAPPQACASPVRYSGLADGAHRFAVVARDVAGNPSTAATHGWTIDTQAPPAPAITAAPAALSVHSNVRFRLSASEQGSALRCRLDGAPAPCGGVDGLSDGEHSFAATAVDAAGNESAPATHRWTIDTVPPDAPVITARPGERAARADATFRFSGTGTICRLDDAPPVPCASPQRYPGPLVSGAHMFAVYARDEAGNRSAAAVATWTVVPGLYREAILATPGLLGYWRLGEAVWGPAADERGVFPGRFIGGLTLGAAGAVLDDPDTAVWFDGLSGEALLTGPVLSADATLEGWFDWRGGTAVLRDHTSGGGWILAFASGTAVMARASGRTFATGLTLDRVRGRWHHLALTKAGAGLVFYLDGQPTAVATGAGNAVSAAPWHVMNNGLVGEQYASGAADEIALYDRALGADEIDRHYRLGRGDA